MKINLHKPKIDKHGEGGDFLRAKGAGRGVWCEEGRSVG